MAARRSIAVLPAALLLAACGAPTDPEPIPGLRAAGFAGAATVAWPVAGAVPAAPFMAGGGHAALHADAYNSDVHPGPGPLGRAPEVRSRRGSRGPGGQCAIHTVDRHGLLVVLCGTLRHFMLQLLEPRSLRLLAEYRLPGRPSTVRALLALDPDRIMSDTSGAYFYRDHEDQTVVADSRARVRRIAHAQDAQGHWQFRETASWDLGGAVFDGCGGLDHWLPWRGCDAMTAVLPDHAGRIWWVTRRGRVGTLDPASGAVRHLRLEGEEIQNGFATAADGVYIASDHALYRFSADADGTPRVGWREAYDRGSGRKSGSINQGTGTSPTLIGERHVVITDNADERIHLRVYRRRQDAAGPRLVCSVPLFEAGASATDNSPIGWGRSVIVANNHGYRNAFSQSDWSAIAGGLTRIDIREDESGCDPVWHSRERAPSVVSKLSAAAGLVYSYGFEEAPDGEIEWQLIALDFRTGATRFRVATGAGRNFDNNWASVSLGPDGAAYVGTFAGLVAVRDTR